MIESTYNWYWLVDGLIEQGYPLHLANTLAIQQYNGIKHTNDQTDARYLAHLLRLGILPTGFIYPKQIRAVRDVLRRRLLLVKQLATEKIKGYLSDTIVQFSALQSHRLLQQLEEQVHTIEAFVLSHCDNERYTLITSTPGIGKILSMTILLETGPIERFHQVGNYSSYARCVPSSKISNGKTKGHGNAKNGNRYLGMAFVEAAHYACIWNATIKKY